jgi:hypothetical protein
LVGAALAAAFGCGPGEPVSLPDHLVGVWTTSDPRYRDRSLELTHDAVLFRLKHAVIDRHPIEEVEERHGDADDRLYVLHYTETEGYDATLELRYRETPTPELSVGNRSIPWTRRTRS